MIKINLANGAANFAAAPGISGDIIFTPAELQKQALLRLVLIAIFPLALWGYQNATVPELLQKRADEQRRLTDLQTFNAQSEKSVQEIKRFKEDEARIQNRINQIDLLSKNRFREIKVLDLVQQVIPEKVWLTKVDMNDGRVVIGGYAMTDYDISGFMESLAKSVYFIDVNLLNSNETLYDGLTIKVFEIACSMEKKP